MAGRSGLVAALRNGAGITWQEANSCASVMIGWLAESLAGGEKIELRGLGTFELKRAAGKEYPSLLSGGKVLPAHGRVVFHPCEKLRRAVWNRGGDF